jgi:hypothetical protein
MEEIRLSRVRRRYTRFSEAHGLRVVDVFAEIGHAPVAATLIKRHGALVDEARLQPYRAGAEVGSRALEKCEDRRADARGAGARMHPLHLRDPSCSGLNAPQPTARFSASRTTTKHPLATRTSSGSNEALPLSPVMFAGVERLADECKAALLGRQGKPECREDDAMRFDDQLAAVDQRAVEIEHDQLHATGLS